jgi:hypothetical protein
MEKPGAERSEERWLPELPTYQQINQALKLDIIQEMIDRFFEKARRSEVPEQSDFVQCSVHDDLAVSHQVSNSFELDAACHATPGGQRLIFVSRLEPHEEAMMIEITVFL